MHDDTHDLVYGPSTVKDIKRQPHHLDHLQKLNISDLAFPQLFANGSGDKIDNKVLQFRFYESKLVIFLSCAITPVSPFPKF